MEGVKKLSRLQAGMMLPLLYETQYGIYDHTNPLNVRPMSAEQFHPAYDTYKDSLLNDLVFRYEENNIHDIFHITFHEYIALPRVVALQYDENARWFRKKRDEKAAAAAKEAEAKMRGIPGGN